MNGVEDIKVNDFILYGKNNENIGKVLSVSLKEILVVPYVPI